MIQNKEFFIEDILKSDNFKEFLEETNQHFFNLKQESIIRNYLVRKINESENFKNQRAFAEFPREGLKRVDLGIINESLQESYLIEFKYNFPLDLKRNGNLKNTINNNINDRTINGKKIDLLILIICEWKIDEYKKILSDLNISSNLCNYQIKKEYDWRKKMVTDWDNNLNITYKALKVEINKPVKTIYDFYLIKNV